LARLRQLDDYGHILSLPHGRYSRITVISPSESLTCNRSSFFTSSARFTRLPFISRTSAYPRLSTVRGLKVSSLPTARQSFWFLDSRTVLTAACSRLSRRQNSPFALAYKPLTLIAPSLKEARCQRFRRWTKLLRKKCSILLRASSAR